MTPHEICMYLYDRVTATCAFYAKLRGANFDSEYRDSVYHLALQTHDAADALHDLQNEYLR